MSDALASIPWTWLAIRASGLTAWALLTAVVVWGLLLRTRLLGRLAGPTALLTMHRWLGALALAFLAGHLALLLVDPVVRFTPLQILVPMASPWRPLAVGLGSLAMWMMLPVAVVGRLRSRLGRNSATIFRRAHLLAYFAWPMATAHYVLAGTDALREWSLGLLLTAVALISTALLVRGFVPPPARPARPARAGQSARPATVEHVPDATPVA